jgi:osmotically-inducible protein OsmY
MTTRSVLALITCLSALAFSAGLSGCIGAHPVQSSDQSIEDSRTAERVRETLAAGADYKYDRVKVSVSEGIVHLSGRVNTSAQSNRAGEVTGKVVGVKQVENNLTVQP